MTYLGNVIRVVTIILTDLNLVPIIGLIQIVQLMQTLTNTLNNVCANFLLKLGVLFQLSMKTWFTEELQLIGSNPHNFQISDWKSSLSYVNINTKLSNVFTNFSLKTSFIAVVYENSVHRGGVPTSQLSTQASNF